jgi:hypothetical protein
MCFFAQSKYRIVYASSLDDTTLETVIPPTPSRSTDGTIDITKRSTIIQITKILFGLLLTTSPFTLTLFFAF